MVSFDCGMRTVLTWLLVAATGIVIAMLASVPILAPSPPIAGLHRNTIGWQVTRDKKEQPPHCDVLKF